MQKYYLTGFLRCGVCGKALTGRDPHHAKRTYYHASGGPCGFHTIPGEAMEARLFNVLYRGFLNQPTLTRPSNVQCRRQRSSCLGREADAARKQIEAKQREIERLADRR